MGDNSMETFDPEKLRLDRTVIFWGLKWAFDIDRWTLILWTVLFSVNAVVPSVFMKITSDIVDQISQNVESGSGIGAVYPRLIALVCVMFFNIFMGSIPNIVMKRLDTKYSIGMQRRMCEFMKKVPVSYFDDPRTAKIMSMAQKDERTLGEFVQSFFYLLYNVISIVSVLVLAFNTSFVLLLVAAVFILCSVPIGIYGAKRDWKSWVGASEYWNIAQYFQNLAFKAEYAKEVRILGLKDRIFQKWDEQRKKALELEIENTVKTTSVWSMVGVFGNIMRLLVMFAAIALLRMGQLTLGGLTIFFSVFESVCGSCSSIGYDIMNLYRISCDLKFKKALFELEFDREKKLIEEADGSRNVPEDAVFACQNVSFSYPGSGEVLSDLSFQINKGEIVALVGENGAGKSTLIKLLLGLYKPDRGSLYFHGVNYETLDTDTLVKQIGVVFQDFVKFDFMVRENVGFGNVSEISDDALIHQALEKSMASHIVKRMPDGINTYMGRWYEQNGVRMSGGEWQRIAAARAYISDRDIMIMDEPAAMLDPIAEMQQFREIRQSFRGKTAILISHRIGFARLADKILVLDQGRLAESGIHEELMENKGIYYRLFSEQARWYEGSECDE